MVSRLAFSPAFPWSYESISDILHLTWCSPIIFWWPLPGAVSRLSLSSDWLYKTYKLLSFDWLSGRKVIRLTISLMNIQIKNHAKKYRIILHVDISNTNKNLTKNFENKIVICEQKDKVLKVLKSCWNWSWFELYNRIGGIQWNCNMCTGRQVRDREKKSCPSMPLRATVWVNN